MNCFQAKAGQLTPQWYVIDATDMVVGRLAAQIAPILMGKHRPTYTPHIDTGDYVIVTNVDKVVFTGDKWQQKSYQRYTGHPGGQKEEVAWKLFKRRPHRILELAIQRMMPKNKIGRHMQAKLKLYVGPQHPHQAQAPIPLTPIDGRPTSSGALWTPEPVPKTKRARPPKPVAPTVMPPAVELPAPTPSTESPVPVTEPSVAVDAPAVEPQAPAPGAEASTIEPTPALLAVAMAPALEPQGSAPVMEPSAVEAQLPGPEPTPALEPPAAPSPQPEPPAETQQ
jgi:large subunit ribosomal protein L13